ncbi:hypothetical protein K438DRAFT_394751 [Mycena galopus ATCC 62051]|nr:hypothetical protein K438DRAFT_394751 [Mycena galopus ATCC 62051]
MSARHPFVPGGFGMARPESRAAQSTAGNAGGFGMARPGPESRAAQSTAGNATTSGTPLHFVADPSNPLNGGPVGVVNLQKERAENPDGRPVPLNIGSLTKSTNRGQNVPSRRQSMQTTTRPLASDPKTMPAPNNIMRPGTSDPHSKSKSVPNHRLQAHANSHGIVSPTPLQPRSTPALFSNSCPSLPSAFKTPVLPGSRLSPQQHPSTDAHGFRASANDEMTAQQPPSPEQYQENMVSDSSLRLKILPSQPGPHRLVFAAPTDLTEDDEIYEVSEAEIAGHNVNGRNKRGRSEVEDDDDEDSHVHGQAKRFKADENPYRRTPNDGNEMYHRPSSLHDAQEYPPPQQLRRKSASRSENHPTPGGHGFPPQYSNPAQSPANSGRSSEISRLVHLLKADDFDLACDARVEKYTRLAEKWKACTREEWMAGAEELTALYAKIFDFAKSHMIAKVKLFAGCDETLKQQGEVLKERDTLLVDVKDRLVAESGNVLGK